MNKKLFLFLVMIGLSGLACATFTVVNPNATAATVMVTLPDEAYGARIISADDSFSWFALEGGTYSVVVLRDEDYIERVRGWRDSLTDAMLEPLTVSNPSSMLLAVTTLADIKTKLENLENQGTTCTGEIPYSDLDVFEYDPFANNLDWVVTLHYNPATTKWSCN
jgi:hypothetical protein